MKYNYNDIEKIVDFKTWSKKQKLDELFRIDSEMYTNLGTDSLKKDISNTKRRSKSIYKAISKIDPIVGKGLIYYMDRPV
jgi:hypothetical protein